MGVDTWGQAEKREEQRGLQKPRPRRSVRHGRETESTGGMLGLAVSKDFSIRCLDFETESLFKRKSLPFFPTRHHRGQCQHGLENCHCYQEQGL